MPSSGCQETEIGNRTTGAAFIVYHSLPKVKMPQGECLGNSTDYLFQKSIYSQPNPGTWMRSSKRASQDFVEPKAYLTMAKHMEKNHFISGREGKIFTSSDVYNSGSIWDKSALTQCLLLGGCNLSYLFYTDLISIALYWVE